jgi:glucosamine-6-phosphate deaminase
MLDLTNIFVKEYNEIMRQITIDKIAVLIGKDLEEATTISADIVTQTVKDNPKAVITYATGNSQILVYEKLVKSGVDFSETTAFHLDEYYPCGTGGDYPYGFVNYLRQRVFEPLNIANKFELNGLAQSSEAEAKRYEDLLNSHPRDLTILGIGPWSAENERGCHIAFNESGAPFESRVNVTELDPVTVARDRQERGQDSPDKALTQGLANIMESKKIILNAFGEKYAAPIYQTLKGKIGVERPSTILRTQPEKVTIVLDEESARLL